MTGQWCCGGPTVRGVRRRRLRKLARSARVAEFPPWTAVVSTGELADAVYVILSGKAEARWRHAARALCAGDYFGEIAVVDGGKPSATVVAETELHVMRVPQDVFLQLAKDEPRIALTMIKELGQSVRQRERTSQAA